jgi:hypothetical protein
LGAELAAPPLAQRPWYLTIAPAYLGLFVWGPFFDQLWSGDLPQGELASLFGTAIAASVLCFCVFYVAASWGLSARRPLGIVAASTFGTVGSEWITGVAIAVASLVWYAVAIDWAVDSTLLGLRATGLIAPESLAGWHLGPVLLKSPVYLCTASFWIYITGTAALLRLTGVIVALMRIYAPVAWLLLTAVAVWLLPTVSGYRPDDLFSIWETIGFFLQVNDSASRMILNFFTMASLTGVGWGAQARGRRDIVLGGLTGIVLAASWMAGMSLYVVAGAAAQPLSDNRWFVTNVLDTRRLSFRWAVFYGIGGVPAGAILILFGLAALAPACYAVWAYSDKLSTHWPRVRQRTWTWVGGAIALVLGATSALHRLDLIFSAMGDVFAPVIGAMAGDWERQNGRWSGVRPGVNRTGIIAWAAGFLVALVLEVDRMAYPESASRLPNAFGGFVTALAVYWLLARLGRDRPIVALGQQANQPSGAEVR